MKVPGLLICLILPLHASVHEGTLRNGILKGSIDLDRGRTEPIAEPMRLRAFGFHMRGSPHVAVEHGRILQIGWGVWSGLNGTSLRGLERFVPVNGLGESAAHQVRSSSTSGETLHPSLAGTIFLLAGENPPRQYLGQVVAADDRALTFRWIDSQDVARADGTLQGLQAMPGDIRDPARVQLWACGAFEAAIAERPEFAAWLTTAGLVPIAGVETIDPLRAVITSGDPRLLAPVLTAGWKLGAQHVTLACQRGYRRLSLWTALNEHGLQPPAEMWADVHTLELLPSRWLDLDTLRQVEPGFSTTAAHAQAIRTFLGQAGVVDPGPGQANPIDAVWHQRADLLAQASPTVQVLRSRWGPYPDACLGWAKPGTLIQHCFRAGAAGCLAAILRSPVAQGLPAHELPIALTLEDLVDLAPERCLPMLADLAAQSAWNPDRLCDGDGMDTLIRHPRLLQELLTVGACPVDAAQRAAMTAALSRLEAAARLPATQVLVDEGMARAAYATAVIEERARLVPLFLRLGTPRLLDDAVIARDATLLPAPVLIAQAGCNLDAGVLAWALAAAADRLGEPTAIAATDTLMEELRSRRQAARLEPLVKALPALRKRIDARWLRETAASNIAKEDREAARRLLKGTARTLEPGSSSP